MTYPLLHLPQIINIYPEHDTECIGWARSKGRKCLMSVSAASRAEASHLLEQATRQLYAGHGIDDILEDIAFLLLCKRWHRDQAPTVSVKWKAEVIRYLAAAAALQHPHVDQVCHKSGYDFGVSVSSSSLVTNELSSLRDTSIYLHSDREQMINQSRLQVQAQTQVQPQRDTRLSIQPSSTFSPPSSPPPFSTEANTEPEADPSTEMFARTSRPQRVVMPTRLNRTKVHPEAVIKRDSQGICTSTSTSISTLEVKTSSSTSVPLPIPKVNRSMTTSPSRQYFEDRARTIDEYMEKLQRMEPPEDETGFEETPAAQKEEQKASILRELRAIVPVRERPSASSVMAPSQKQTTLLEGVVVEGRKRVVDEYMDGVRLMDYGRGETDSDEDVGEMKGKVKGALVAQIKQIGMDIKRAGEGKNSAHTSRKMPEEKKIEVEESPLTSKPADVVHPVPILEDAAGTSTKTPKDIDINVDVNINANKPTTQPPDVTTIVQPIKDEDKVSIITGIREIADDESENLVSASPHSSSSSSSSSSTHSFPAPFSSTSSLESLKRSSDLLSMAMQEPHMKDHIINNNDGNNNTTNNTNQPNQPQEPPSINAKDLTLSQPIRTLSTIPHPNNKHPPRPENPYPTLTTGLDIGIALFDGLAWLLDRNTFSVCVWLGVYLQVLSAVGML